MGNVKCVLLLILHHYLFPSRLNYNPVANFRISGTFLARGLDLTVNPCDDFYSHACGSYKNLQNPSVLSLPEIMDERKEKFIASYLEGNITTEDPSSVHKIVQAIYTSCVNKRRCLFR